MMYNAILGLDPGRDKTGFALVSPSGELYFSGVIFGDANWTRFLEFLIRGSVNNIINVRINDFAPWILERPVNENSFVLTAVAFGNGTYSKALEKKIHDLRCRVICIDEYGTTLAARELYWQLHRPSFFKRLLPKSMRVPPRPLDDLAAWAIVRRGLDMNLI